MKLNGFGYLAIATVVLFPIKSLSQFRPVAHQILGAYAFVTIALYFVLNGEGGLDNIVGLSAKLVEFLLIGMTMIEGRRIKRKRIAYSHMSPYTSRG